jgi:hypothetical protein
VDFAQQLLDRPFPWRTATLVAAGVALVELVGLLALAGVHLAPSVHRAAQARAASPSRTPASRALARTPAARAHALRARSRISVLVLNGNGVSGAAGRTAARLLARGYRHAVPADAASHHYARSFVLFAPGYVREGRRLAHDTGVRAVAPLDGMRRSQLRGSQLVVILGGN